ncbi:MAG: cysteine--tRNA ligase [Anaerolineae bacterium]|nr:cysteine--tRNA ligase [Anaerolineae bacterium]
MALRIYNYLTRKQERFRPINRERVSLYVCGPTVYDHSHLGHAKTYLAIDVMVRYLIYYGFNVRYVRNLTDVGHILSTGEDRILHGARRESKGPYEIVDTYIRSFEQDMAALGAMPPNISPRATCHVPEIIDWVENLISQGYAYEVNGSVYFSVEKFPEYGKLANRKVDQLVAGARVDVRDEKQHPADFALWKRAEPEHIMHWSSPWGEGYPGWHIECSVMSTKYLGKTFDIHGGGLENVFPHNDCEIAQAEAHNEQPFANYWVLVGSLTVDGVKMSKSLGNFMTIKDALKQYSLEAIRYFILSSHYRGPVDVSDQALQAAQTGVNRLHNTTRKLREKIRDAVPFSGGETGTLASVSALEDFREDFKKAMDDDFNTPQALATIFALTKEINRTLDESKDPNLGTLATMNKIMTDLAGDVLGILPQSMVAPGDDEDRLVEKLVETLLDMRQEFRADNNWQKADEIRDRLLDAGIVIEDGQDRSTWHVE